MAAMTRIGTRKAELNTGGGGNTSGRLAQPEIVGRLHAAVAAVQPAQCYVSNGGMRLLEFEGGLLVDLHDRTPAIVVMVLSEEQARGLPDGVTDVSEL